MSLAHARQYFAESMAKRPEAYRQKLAKWRGQPKVVRVGGPSNPARARSLGYKAKKEFCVVRVRIAKGKRARRKPKLGRKPGKNVKRVALSRSLRWMAERKALSGHRNLELVGSYFVGNDGSNEYFEVILKNEYSSKPVPWLGNPRRTKASPAPAPVKPVIKAKPKPAKPAAKPAVASA